MMYKTKSEYEKDVFFVALHLTYIVGRLLKTLLRDREQSPQPWRRNLNPSNVLGRKKTAVAVTHCKHGRGLIKINDVPIELVQLEILRLKAFELVLLLGRHRFARVDMLIRVKDGGQQSISKALVAIYQKYVDKELKKEINDILVRYDRTLLVADPRRCEPKKFGGRGARSRFQ